MYNSTIRIGIIDQSARANIISVVRLIKRNKFNIYLYCKIDNFPIFYFYAIIRNYTYLYIRVTLHTNLFLSLVIPRAYAKGPSSNLSYYLAYLARVRKIIISI